jgi:hypothetical protein
MTYKQLQDKLASVGLTADLDIDNEGQIIAYLNLQCQGEFVGMSTELEPFAPSDSPMTHLHG